jgi:UPF0716 family protein affecting phage T7 exclusion
MSARVFQFRTVGARGLPSLLILILGVALVIGLIAVIAFLGIFVAAIGLMASLVAGLYYAARRQITGQSAPGQPPEPTVVDGGPLHDIQVDEIILLKEDKD